LSAILRDEGYEVAVAIDGQKALDQLAAENFGVVLADLKMPKVDGLALLKELQLRGIPTAKAPTTTSRSRSPPTN
jgi:CheY-like chemotaxis protein